jgi:DNA-binding transcriptional regulator/RsmH inhibitor MraZ
MRRLESNTTTMIAINRAEFQRFTRPMFEKLDSKDAPDRNTRRSLLSDAVKPSTDGACELYPTK